MGVNLNILFRYFLKAFKEHNTPLPPNQTKSPLVTASEMSSDDNAKQARKWWETEGKRTRCALV